MTAPTSRVSSSAISSCLRAPATAYTQTVWTTGTANGSDVIINSVTGSLTTGSTTTIGGPVFGCMAHNNLHFRTLMSKSPNTLSVAYDEAFFYVSGITSIINGQNVGTGVAVLKVPTGTTLQFRRLLGSGNTTVTQVGDTIIINSIGGTGGTTGGTGTITGATNGLYVTGKKIGLGGTLCQNTNINGVAAYDLNIINIDQFQVDTAGGVGNQIILGLNPGGIYMEHCGTAVDLCSNRGLEYQGNYSANFSNCSLITKEYAKSLVASGSTYNLSSPAAITVGGISGGTILTGKTSFQLFEELLVPTLYPTLTPPSNTISINPSGIFEIGCNIATICVTSTFDAGCINPQYTALCSKRSNGVCSHEFDGCQIAGSYPTNALSLTECATSYVICLGAQSWCTHVHYSGGTQPKNNKGGNYCAPLSAGETSCCQATLTGAYPLFATTSNITTLTKQTLVNMATANNIQINLCADSTPNKQKFEIPCAWLGAPISRPLVGVCQWNTVSSQWEYPGGTAGTSLNLWACSAASETTCAGLTGYCRYTYCCVDRSAVCIRLVF
jgi:hypothetical protein